MNPIGKYICALGLVTTFSLNAAYCADDGMVLLSLTPPEFTAAEAALIERLPGYFKASPEVALLEGMPHSFFESELEAKELSKNKHASLGGQKFYAEAQMVSSLDRNRLLKVLSEKTTYSASSLAPKQCGGFHADYALQWKNSKDTLSILVCFGCAEFKILGPGFELNTDMTSSARAELKQLLKKYRKLRPDSGGS